MRAIRTFSILKNDSDSERIKVDLKKNDDGMYQWVYEDDDFPAFETIEKAVEWAKAAYRTSAWKMRSNW
jgi:hypothetical protein